MFRYGSEAGQFTEHVVDSAVGVAAATYNVSNLGISVMAKRAAADSVIAMGSSSSSSLAASGPHCNPGAFTSNTQECNIPPAYRENITPANNVAPVDDDVTPESSAVAVVPSAK